MLRFLFIASLFFSSPAAQADTKTIKNMDAFHRYLETFFNKKIEQHPLLVSVGLSGINISLLETSGFCEIAFGKGYAAAFSNVGNALTSKRPNKDTFYVLGIQNGTNVSVASLILDVHGAGKNHQNHITIDGVKNKIIAQRELSPIVRDPSAKRYVVLVQATQAVGERDLMVLEALTCKKPKSWQGAEREEEIPGSEAPAQ